MHDPRLDKLAGVLVDYSLGVKPGNTVLVKGSPVAEPLIVAAVRHILRAGGHPIVRCVPEAVEELLLKLGNTKQVEFYAPGDVLEIEKVNCYLAIWASVNTRALTGVDPKKQQVRSKARRRFLDVFMKRSAMKGPKQLRWVGTQFPSQASAQDADMSLSDYADFVFRGGLLHLPNPAAAWRKLRTRQQRMVDYLNKAKEVRFRTPAGTDLRVGVAGRTWINCDGKLNFPDGEVFTGPIEDATEGEVHYTFPAIHGGREVTDVVLRFKNGRVVDASASKNEDFLFKMLDQDKGARCLGEIAIGTNYAIKQFSKNTLFDEKIGGTFHAAVGAAYPESGGKNQSALHWDMVCDLRKGGTIEVDGKVISKNGKFVNKTWPQAGR
ncbi:MAG: aminopeptidase [Phycisphaerales bacterium]|nr:aminopeptidase [Phycisphaerales bacterium]